MKRAISILVLLLLCFSTYGQEPSLTEQKSEMIEIFFDHNNSAIDPDFRQNGESLSNLSALISRLENDTLSTISKIEISSYASPEGGRSYNQRLSNDRINAIYDHLTSTINIPSSLISKAHSGTDWDGLKTLVEQSNMQYRDEVLHILNTVPEETWRRVKPTDSWETMVDSRNKQLMDLYGGAPYNYLSDNFFAQLRRGSVLTIFLETIEQVVEVAAVEQPAEQALIQEPEVIEEVTQPQEPIYTTNSVSSSPLLAIKTNLLFDLATVINVELEFYINENWSVAAEWIFPWWTSCGGRSDEWQSGSTTSDRNTLQMLSGNLEAKYWLGDRSSKAPMTGWHVGIYAGGGKYDLEYNAEGYQGEFFIAAGLSAGYAHTINKRGDLRMEYSVGVGYLQTEYRYYEEHLGIDDTWHTIRQNTGKYSWFGPTRARVSLVWMLNRKAK